jgi:hypothetical protein
MVLDSGVDIEGTALASRTRLIATTQTDLDSMLLSICPKDFWDQHIDMTLENRGITISFRVGYT